MINDQREPEKYKRYCRACTHAFSWHETVAPSYRTIPGGWCAKKHDPPLMGIWKSCACKEYIPKDNLEYLEWLYDKSNSKV